MYGENIEEEADVKDIMTSEEKRGLEARGKNYSSKLAVLMEKFGSQNRLDIDRLDTEINAQTEGIDSVIGNLERAINIEMSNINKLQETKGYDNLLGSVPDLKETIEKLKKIIKGMIQQIQFLNISIEYLNAEKEAIVEKLRTNKNSEVVLGVIEKQEKIQKANFDTLKEFFQESLNSVKEENRLLRARLFGVSDAEKNEEEKIKKEKILAIEKRKIEEQKKIDLENEKNEQKPDLLGEIG